MITLLEFFSGLFPFPVEDSFIIANCGARGYDAETTTLSMIGLSTRELLRADLLKALALSLIGWQSKTSSTAFSAEQRGEGMSTEQRRSMLNEANSLYRKYGEPESVVRLNAINVWEDEQGC